jgi:hypothetical protein
LGLIQFIGQVSQVDFSSTGIFVGLQEKFVVVLFAGLVFLDFFLADVAITICVQGSDESLDEVLLSDCSDEVVGSDEEKEAADTHEYVLEHFRYEV